MMRKYFKNNYDRLVAKEIANKIVSIVLATALVVCSVVIYKLQSEQKVIIVPTNTTKEFWATNSNLSETYLKQMGQYVSTALLNVSPNNAKEQFALILDLAAPTYYQTLKAELANQTRYLVENGITSAFWARTFKYEKDHIAVQGTKEHIISDKIVKKEEVNLKIFFEVQNGRFYISSFVIK